MFPGVPRTLIREHHWRDDVVTIGEVPAEFVREVTEGIYDQPGPPSSTSWCGKGATT